MKLYCFPPSPNSRKVQALALELGLALDPVIVNLPAGEQKKPEYLKINPSGRTPTLVDGDFVLSESNAIMQYVAAKAGDTPLWPKDGKMRALINAWLCWQLDHWNRSCNVLLWENLVKQLLFGMGDADPNEVKRGEGMFNTYAAELNNHLMGREYLVGKNLTLADLAIAAPLEYAVPGKLPLDAYADIRRWYEGIAKRDSWRKTAPRMN